MSTARSYFPPEPPPERGPQPVPKEKRGPRHPWGRYLGWAGIVVLGLIVLVVGVAITLLHSQRFHHYLLAKVESSVEQSMNTRMTVQNFAVHFSPLGLDVYGVVVDGASPYPNPPLLQLQHAHVGIGITSLVQRKWYLTDVRLDRPVVHVFVDKNGVSNIPKSKPSNSKSSTNLWDLGIRHTVLDRGEIYYNAEATPLSADLHDLELRADFSKPQTMYSGELKYTEGRVVFGTYRPFVHNFDAVFDATPSTFQLHRAQLSSGATQVNLAATATDFSAPHVQAQY
ncbi:MAG TPA: AsmA family protein, partial [Acidobacteriaceae bacterium]|nr:AsmA family protein [Acidobacteriaceae bacterium]